jgi:hypothetical protein
MAMERRGESSTSKRKRFARGGNRQIVASRKDPVIAPGAIHSAFLMFSFGFGDAAQHLAHRRFYMYATVSFRLKYT